MNTIKPIQLFLPASGDADSISYHYSNRLWLDCLQYSLKDLKQINDNFLATVVNENDHYRVRKLIRELSCADNDKLIKNTFTLNCKDRTEFTALWTCAVSLWHYRGRPRLISCCGIDPDENFRDRDQMQVYLNRCAHSKKIKLAKALDEEYFNY